MEIAPGIWLPKAEQYCSGASHVFPILDSGLPAAPWVLTMGRSNDWTLADADPEVTKILQHPSNDWGLVRQGLRNTAFSTLALAERNRIVAVFGQLGVPADDFTGNTTLFRMVRRLISWLLEQDDHLGNGIQF
jgi:hypothetical protein